MGRTVQDNVSERLDALEIKASYAEDLLDQLNLTIYQQQQMIERLCQELVLLREQAGQGASAAQRHLRDEIPPHY